MNYVYFFKMFCYTNITHFSSNNLANVAWPYTVYFFISAKVVRTEVERQGALIRNFKDDKSDLIFKTLEGGLFNSSFIISSVIFDKCVSVGIGFKLYAFCVEFVENSN